MWAGIQRSWSRASRLRAAKWLDAGCLEPAKGVQFAAAHCYRTIKCRLNCGCYHKRYTPVVCPSVRKSLLQLSRGWPLVTLEAAYRVWCRKLACGATSGQPIQTKLMFVAPSTCSSSRQFWTATSGLARLPSDGRNMLMLRPVISGLIARLRLRDDLESL